MGVWRSRYANEGTDLEARAIIDREATAIRARGVGGCAGSLDAACRYSGAAAGPTARIDGCRRLCRVSSRRSHAGVLESAQHSRSCALTLVDLAERAQAVLEKEEH